MVYAITPNRCGPAVFADKNLQTKADKLCISLDDLYRKHHKKSLSLSKVNKLIKSSISS